MRIVKRKIMLLKDFILQANVHLCENEWVSRYTLFETINVFE